MENKEKNNLINFPKALANEAKVKSKVSEKSVTNPIQKRLIKYVFFGKNKFSLKDIFR